MLDRYCVSAVRGMVLPRAVHTEYCVRPKRGSSVSRMLGERSGQEKGPGREVENVSGGKEETRKYLSNRNHLLRDHRSRLRPKRREGLLP